MTMDATVAVNREKKMEDLGVILTAIGGIMAAVIGFIKWLWNAKKHRQAKRQVNAASRTLEIKMVITELCLKLEAAKVLVVKIHNGGDLINPSHSLNLTVLDEYRDEEIKNLGDATRYKSFRLGFDSRQLFCSLPGKKQTFQHPETTPSAQMSAIWEAQDLKTTAMIYLGMNTLGMHVMHISYQLRGIDHFPPADRRHVDIAISDLQNLFDLY